LKEAGIAAILDHHALPGVAAENQMFAGRCVRILIPTKAKLISVSKVHFGCPVLRQ
jgi:hypothetical protein